MGNIIVSFIFIVIIIIIIIEVGCIEKNTSAMASEVDNKHQISGSRPSQHDTDFSADIPEPKQAPQHQFPEGGLKAWLAVVACWCIMFNTFGYINAFG
jgi:hypothetical protein